VLAALIVSGQEIARPSYEVARTRVPIKVDGKLDDSAWTRVPVVGNFVNNADGSRLSSRLRPGFFTMKLSFTFHFAVVDDNIWATLKRRDQHLWLEEVVELFLQADERQPGYIEVEVNRWGQFSTLYASMCANQLHYESWNSEKLPVGGAGCRTVDGKGGDREWTCEIALPMEDIVTAPHLPPQAGDRWRLNLYRVDQRPAISELAWSPTLQNDSMCQKDLGKSFLRSGRSREF